MFSKDKKTIDAGYGGRQENRANGLGVKPHEHSINNTPPACARTRTHNQGSPPPHTHTHTHIHTHTHTHKPFPNHPTQRNHPPPPPSPPQPSAIFPACSSLLQPLTPPTAQTRKNREPKGINTRAKLARAALARASTQAQHSHLPPARHLFCWGAWRRRGPGQSAQLGEAASNQTRPERTAHVGGVRGGGHDHRHVGVVAIRRRARIWWSYR